MHATAIVERIQQKIHEAAPTARRISGGVGGHRRVSIVASDGTVPIETLIARADSALYQAKIKDVINGLINPETLPGKGEGMKRIALCTPVGATADRLRWGKKASSDRDGYQLDTRHPAQAAIRE